MRGIRREMGFVPMRKAASSRRRGHSESALSESRVCTESLFACRVVACFVPQPALDAIRVNNRHERKMRKAGAQVESEARRANMRRDVHMSVKDGKERFRGF